MKFLNKSYCSHCGTPNITTNQICSKSDKPISSALHTPDYGESKRIKPSKFKKRPVVEDDDEDDGNWEIVIPSSNDVVIQKSCKLTIASLQNGADIPNFGMETLPPDIEISSKSFFKQEKLD